jgi:hypothetical protein
MRFECTNHSPATDRHYSDVCFLINDNWDDFGFKTTFDVVLFDERQNRHELGHVKILKFGWRGGAVPVPEKFSSLDEDWCSLGNSRDYYVPFHVYSMRQAIEEGFILDVLKNYTPYRLAFRLANNGKEWDDKEVERDAALKQVMRWVRLHPYNISQKVQIVVEHFRENVVPLLDGRAKAMVVLGSRVEAVRWQLAINKYIKSNGYKIGLTIRRAIATCRTTLWTAPLGTNYSPS